jgi:hypothetical protein
MIGNHSSRIWRVLESNKVTSPGGIWIDSGVSQPISCVNTDKSNLTDQALPTMNAEAIVVSAAQEVRLLLLALIVAIPGLVLAPQESGG